MNAKRSGSQSNPKDRFLTTEAFADILAHPATRAFEKRYQHLDWLSIPDWVKVSIIAGDIAACNFSDMISNKAAASWICKLFDHLEVQHGTDRILEVICTLYDEGADFYRQSRGIRRTAGAMDFPGVDLLAVDSRGRTLVGQVKNYTLHDAEFALDPPEAATYLLLLVPRKYREHLAGDLEEEYWTAALPRHGVRKAQLWYWWQVILILAPLIWIQLRRLIAMFFFWKFFR